MRGSATDPTSCQAAPRRRDRPISDAKGHRSGEGARPFTLKLDMDPFAADVYAAAREELGRAAGGGFGWTGSRGVIVAALRRLRQHVEAQGTEIEAAGEADDGTVYFSFGDVHVLARPAGLPPVWAERVR